MFSTLKIVVCYLKKKKKKKERKKDYSVATQNRLVNGYGGYRTLIHSVKIKIVVWSKRKLHIYDNS